MRVREIMEKEIRPNTIILISTIIISLKTVIEIENIAMNLKMMTMMKFMNRKIYIIILIMMMIIREKFARKILVIVAIVKKAVRKELKR